MQYSKQKEASAHTTLCFLLYHMHFSPFSSPLMAETNISRKVTKPCHQRKKKALQRAGEQQQQQQQQQHSPWGRTLRSFFSCKYHHTATEVLHQKKKKKLRESSKVMQRPEAHSPESNNGIANCNSTNNISLNGTSSSSLSSSSSSSSSSSVGGSFRGMHVRRLSGCYECRTVLDPVPGLAKAPSLKRTNVFACSRCAEIFTKSESLELHRAVKHAVSELGPEDNSRNIVEIIFQSSWLKKQAPVCKIDRILKVHNTQKTITMFESYRDSIKSRANKLAKKHARSVADGNELLRFHCTSIACSIGLNGSTSLCLSSLNCSVCSIVRDGFKPDAVGKIRTMATSGGAHDVAGVSSDGKERAMLVCRVIAGRVSKNQEGLEECDSVAGSTGMYSNLDELVVFDSQAILPCFVVIYRGF